MFLHLLLAHLLIWLFLPNPHDNLIQTTNDEQKSFFLAVGGVAADGYTKNFEIKGDTLTQHR